MVLACEPSTVLEEIGDPLGMVKPITVKGYRPPVNVGRRSG